MATDDTTQAGNNAIEAVEFFWRPGCGFCMALDRGLSKAGIPMNKRNIWENPDDAAVVRSHANGNETVPTVVVGNTAMVNPRVGQVIEALRNEAPHLVPADADTDGAVGRLSQRIFGK